MADDSSITILSKNAERKQFKTPRLYKEAAKILGQVEKQGLGVKNCLFQAKHKNTSSLSAIVCQIIQNRALLDHLISTTELDKETNVDPFLLKVVINEQLFRKNTLTSRSKAVLVVQNKLEALEKALAEHGGDVEKPPKPSKDFLEIPRYGRVNLLKTTLEEVVFRLESDGFVKVDYDPKIPYNNYIDLVKNLTVEQFLHDIHVENLLVFHQKTNFFKHSLYTSGKLLLQDKASCLPALFLNPPPDSFVLDACAAPGMKTTHLSALMNNTGEILAMDKDKDRAAVLTTILESAGATNTQVKVKDFTTVNVNKKPYSLVDYILLDPSCSGSGMVKRSTIFEEESKDDDHSRIGRLTTFQKTMLMKALSFPNVKRVVYSTCSIHTWENEEVISRTLKQADTRFQLVNVNGQRDWPFSNSEIAKFPAAQFKCIRTVPKRDLTNGFFVAVFERIEKKENSDDVPAEGISVSGENAEKPEIVGSKKSKGKRGKVAKILQDAESDTNIQDIEKQNGDASSGNEGDEKQHKRNKHKKSREDGQDHIDEAIIPQSPTKLEKRKKGAINAKSDTATEDFVKLDGDTSSGNEGDKVQRKHKKTRVVEHDHVEEVIVPQSPAKLGKSKKGAVDVQSDVAIDDFVKLDDNSESLGNRSTNKRHRKKKIRVVEHDHLEEAIVPQSPAKLGKAKKGAIDVKSDVAINDFVKLDNVTESLENISSKKRRRQKKSRVAEHEDENNGAIEDFVKPDNKMEISGNEGGKKQCRQTKRKNNPVAEQEDENKEAMDSVSPAKKKKDTSKKMKISPIPEDIAAKSPSPAKKTRVKDSPKRKLTELVSEDVDVELSSLTKKKRVAKNSPKKTALHSENVAVEEVSKKLRKSQRRKNVT